MAPPVRAGRLVGPGQQLELAALSTVVGQRAVARGRGARRGRSATVRTPPPPSRATAAAAGGRQQPGLAQVGRVGEAGGLADDDPDAGAPGAARGQLLDPAVVEHGAGRRGVLGEDLGHVAPAGQRGREDAFEHVGVDEGGVGHGGIVIVVPDGPIRHTDRRGARAARRA